MPKASCLLIALFVVPLIVPPAAAQSRPGTVARAQGGQAYSRKPVTRPADEDDGDEDEDEDMPVPTGRSPQPFARPADRAQPSGASQPPSNPRRPAASPVDQRVTGSRNRSATARDADDNQDDLEDLVPSRARTAAGAQSAARDPKQPARHTTINRAQPGSQPARRNPTTYLTQFEETDRTAPGAAAAGLQPAEEPAANVPTLEEQIAELRARLDGLTAAQNAASPPGEPSTVQGSVFGPDAPPQPASMGSPAANSGPPSTVLGSVFGVDATSGTHSWVSDGLTFVSRDGNFKTHLGGLVQLDVIGFAHDTPGITSIPGGAGINESVTFRRLRVRADGTMYKYIDWVAEFDFAFALQNVDQRDAAAQTTGLRSFPTGVGIQGGNTINVIQPTTTFLTFKEVPILGNIRVGNQQSWFSFEHIESARFLDFMERSPLMDVFSGPNNNGYTPGISAFNNTPNQMAGAQIGVYHNNVYDSGFTFDIGDAWTYGGRLIWTPYYDEESKGRYLLHTGFGTEYRTFNNAVSAQTGFDNIRLRSRGDLRNASSTLDPNYADTGNFYATSQTVIDPEIVLQLGSLLIQTEYTASWINGARPAKNVNTDLGTVFFNGYYVEALYFLTGENRNYNRQQGVFGRVVPINNWDRDKGTWGAWQVGVRYDTVDLNSGKFVNGGNASDMTFGLNWFLNANARFQFNYVLSWVNNAPATTFPGTVGALNGSRFVGDGTINSFGARMDFNW